MTDKSLLNPVKNRFLPLPRSAVEGLEHEPTLDDFDFIKELGFGSFGEVHLAVHKKTKAQYAIKVINKLLPDNLEEKANFSREVEIMYKLDHPNIVKLYGHFEDQDFCYFIMQYIPKRSLFEIITKPHTKPNLKLIASVMKDLINAVYYLHHMKPVIIHRDIKPENVLLDENSKAYLTDFGWSNYIKSEQRRHTVCGSPLYLPPEMVGNFGHDETADIWCIGVLLFELIVGKTPFPGNDILTLKNNIKKLNIAWPSEMDPDAKDLTARILKLNGKDRLPIEDILNHNFFKRYFPNAVNELIKPDPQKNRIFVVSKDNPKTWGQQTKQQTSYTSNIKTSINNTIPKYTKIVNTTNASKDVGKAQEKYVPRANIDISKYNERNYRRKPDNTNIKILDNNTNKASIKINNSYNSNTYNKSSYKNQSNSNSFTISNNKNDNKNNNSNRNSNKNEYCNRNSNNSNSINNNSNRNSNNNNSNRNSNNNNSNRNSNKNNNSNRNSNKNNNSTSTSNSSYSSSMNYRNSYKPSNINVSYKTSNYSTDKFRNSYKNQKHSPLKSNNNTYHTSTVNSNNNRRKHEYISNNPINSSFNVNTNQRNVNNNNNYNNNITKTIIDVRRSYRPNSQNIGYYTSSYNSKK